MKIENFINNNTLPYAIYDNIRSLSSYIDGQKEASRKVLHILLKNKISTPMRVDNLANLITLETSYEHTPTSLMGVIVNMGQDFNNNLPIFSKKSFFGSRLLTNAAAPRYCKGNAPEYLETLFPKEYNPLLLKQQLEGKDIEPRYYIPIIPLILVNGSKGISTGFAQIILPRDIKKIIKYIKGETENFDDTPKFPEFQGTVLKGENTNQWIIRGKIELYSKTEILISDLPYGKYSLDDYLNILNDLKDKKVIKNFEDLSDTKNKKFKFIVKSFSKIDNLVDWYNKLKLETTITENFTCIDETNSIVVFKNAQELLDRFIELKLEYTRKYQDYQINKFLSELDKLKNKIKFLEDVISGKIKFKNNTKEDIINLLKKEFSEVNSNYDYLLNIPIWNLTQDNLKKLKKEYDNLKSEMEEFKKLSEKDIYFRELDNLKNILNK